MWGPVWWPNSLWTLLVGGLWRESYRAGNLHGFILLFRSMLNIFNCLFRPSLRPTAKTQWRMQNVTACRIMIEIVRNISNKVSMQRFVFTAFSVACCGTKADPTNWLWKGPKLGLLVAWKILIACWISGVRTLRGVAENFPYNPIQHVTVIFHFCIGYPVIYS